MTRKPQTRRRFLQASGATVASTVTAGIVSQTVAAETNGPPHGLLADGLGVEGGNRIAFIKGYLSSFSFRTEPTAETLADRMRNEFTANTDHWLSYGNWLLESAPDDFHPRERTVLQVDVVASRWISDDELVPTVIKSQYDRDSREFTGLLWEIGEPDDPHYEAELRDVAAENAADELQEFRRKFIDEDGDDHQLPDEKYVSRMFGRYSSAIGIGEEGKSILQLLVGDSDGI